jgi:hypothetical protein
VIDGSESKENGDDETTLRTAKLFFLAGSLCVGLHATENDNDRSATESSVNLEGDTSGCYDCSCKSLSMGSGSPTEKAVSSGGCGLQTDSRWGVTCGDVTNGRYNWVGDEMVASNFSHVQVSICPENQSHCSLCQGGLHPSFRVRLHHEIEFWIYIISF